MYPGIEERVATCLPKSGGTMTGNINGTQTDTAGYAFGTTGTGVRLKAGEFGYGTIGAYIDLNKSSGEFSIRANTGSSGVNIALTGRVDGTLKWENKNIETVDSSSLASGNGWIRYSNGLQICYGNAGFTAKSVTTKTFPKAFKTGTEPRVVMTRYASSGNTTYVGTCVINVLSASSFTFICSDGGNSSWIAIGQWA